MGVKRNAVETQCLCDVCDVQIFCSVRSFRFIGFLPFLFRRLCVYCLSDDFEGLLLNSLPLRCSPWFYHNDIVVQCLILIFYLYPYGYCMDKTIKTSDRIPRANEAVKSREDGVTRYIAGHTTSFTIISKTTSRMKWIVQFFLPISTCSHLKRKTSFTMIIPTASFSIILCIR